MKNEKVISVKNLPARFPVLTTAVSYLYLDKYNAAGWVWGVVGTVLAILWILVVIVKAYEEETDILK